MKLVVLGQDGVVCAARPGPLRHPGDVVVPDGAAAACRRLTDAGIRTVVAVNDDAVALGMMSAEMATQIQMKLRDDLARAGARIDLWLTCAAPAWSQDERRIPKPGMVLEALRHFRVAPGAAAVVAATQDHLKAAATAQVRRILLRSGPGAAVQAAGLPDDILPVAVYDTLHGAVEALLQER